MTRMLDCVDKLAGEIGARPVGTDEEQKAAFFIEDTLRRETNFQVELQEFDAARNPELARVVPAAITLLGCILGFALPTTPIAPLLLTLVGGVLFVCNELGIFSLAQYFGKAPSQNVVAIHEPAGGATSKKKIVILTNYDSEKTRADEASGMFAQLGHAKMFEVGAFALAFLASLIMFFAGSNMFVTILLVLGIVGSALPIAIFIAHKGGKFTPGANNNAASVAVMLEAAKRISTGVYAPHGETPIIHGRAAAEEAGAMPGDTPVFWEDEMATSSEANAAVESLFFNKDRSGGDRPSLEGDRPLEEAPIIQPAEIEQQYAPDTQQVVTYDAPAPEPVAAAAATSAPAWFTRGKEKAGDKGNTNAGNVKRSTYGDAYASAQESLASVQAARQQEDDLQKKLQAIHDQIESSSAKASDAAATDAQAAEKVLDNEIKEDAKGVPGYLEKETSASDFEASKEVEPKDVKVNIIDQAAPAAAPSAEKPAAEVPALKPLEPEYGVEVDPNDFLDTSKTAPMNAVNGAVEAQIPAAAAPRVTVPAVPEVPAVPASAAKPQVAAAPKPAPAPKRDIALPSLTGAIESKKVNEALEKQRKEEEREAEAKAAEAKAKMSINLPSLTAEVPAAKAKSHEENKAVSNVSAFGVGDATGTFAPITDEDLRRANAGEDDMYVYDADDSALQDATDSGAVAGQGYVDIPDTHTESIFGKLFHKDEKINTDVWSDDDDWNGGAVVVGESTPEQVEAFNEAFNERDEIYNFATNDIGAEVWCVALGAEASNHSGLDNFLHVNGADLKGAKFITLDAMGAGDLCVVEKEGVFKPQSVQTRLKRFARDAAKGVGISAKSENMLWKETTSSKLGAKGHKYIHLAGFEGGKPALLSSEKDTPDAIDADALQLSADYLMELVRTL